MITDINEKEEENMFVKNIILNPSIVIVLFILIVLYYGLFSKLGIEDKEHPKSKMIIIFEMLLWSIFIALLLINGLIYIYDFNVIDYLQKLLGLKKEINIILDSDNLRDTKNGRKKEVYHIPGNHYTYDDAKAICLSKGSRLATWKEMYEAYNKGADWCSYGWSDGQMALFPTQYEKWANLQSIDNHEHDCGRPGVNGGFIKDKLAKFGVNCFGAKPQMNSNDMEYKNNLTLYPETEEDKEFKKKIKYWETQSSHIAVAPFDNDHWNETYV